MAQFSRQRWPRPLARWALARPPALFQVARLTLACLVMRRRLETPPLQQLARPLLLFLLAPSFVVRFCLAYWSLARLLARPRLARLRMRQATAFGRRRPALFFQAAAAPSVATLCSATLS